MKYKPVIISLIILLLLIFIAVILTPVSRKPAAIKKRAAYKGRIAIVIDDWGYHLNNLGLAKQINHHLTCAVLPNLKNTSFVAQELNNSGFEIILHLPMEPKEKYSLEKNTITSDMDSQKISSILDKDLASVKFAKGISNHMGSRATENRIVMSVVLGEAKKRRLYFLDSYVTAGSVCKDIAAKTRVGFAKRDVFLDNQDNVDYIRAQLIRLKNLAKRQGSAIGIGHDRKNTLTVLKEMIPSLEKEGYKFIFVSEITR